jgi:hypothetical protein
MPPIVGPGTIKGADMDTMEVVVFGEFVFTVCTAVKCSRLRQIAVEDRSRASNIFFNLDGMKLNSKTGWAVR